MQISCLIVDDEPLAVQLLQQYIEGMPYLRLNGVCYTAMEALSIMHHQKIDLLFLDINMPKLSGTELARIVGPQQKIIFTTAYSEYAVESYEVNAVDYLLKPITFDRFIKSVNKVIEFYKVDEEEQSIVVSPRQDKHFFIKTGKAFVQVHFKMVLYIEGTKDYVTFHTTEGKHMVYKRMKDLELLLPADFLRVHNSYIINRQHIKKIEEHHVQIDNELLPVSEKYREPFYAAIQKNIL